MKPISDVTIRTDLKTFAVYLRSVVETLTVYLRKRTWARVAVILAVCGLSLLHPFPRQSLFGPTIEGFPWCTWENEIRDHAHGRWHQESPFLAKVKKLIPWEFPWERPDIGGPFAWPVYVELADDSDVKVRRFALKKLE